MSISHVAKSLIDAPDFLRLGLMLALERRHTEPRGRTVFLQGPAQRAGRNPGLEDALPLPCPRARTKRASCTTGSGARASEAASARRSACAASSTSPSTSAARPLKWP